VVLIRPEVAMYAAFARLNYKAWYALAEFVDNSLQSAIAHRAALEKVDGGNYRLAVSIDTSETSVEIRDNAAGIAINDYARAFLPASPPPDTTGLSEFGLGMKAAASWYAKTWQVRSKALGESVERTITFDVPHIVRTNCERLEPLERPAPAAQHYTTLSLRDLQVLPKGRTLGKIHDHLSSIYRIFIRDGILELKLNGETLTYAEPTFLVAPYHSTPRRSAQSWRKDITLDLGDGHRVTGWAGILSRASVTNAGFAIFRRRRLVQGSYGEAYRPEKIFGKPNKFVYQRLVGELEVEGFSVSHTKDGIQWDDWEEDILNWLKIELNTKPLPLLDQAANYRARASINADRNPAKDAAMDTSQAIAQHLPPVIDQQLGEDPDEEPLTSELEVSTETAVRSGVVKIVLEHAHRTWQIEIELVSEADREAWYEIAESARGSDVTHVQIRVNLSHPFMMRFVQPDGEEIIPFTRLAAGLAISELTAREVGVRQAGTIRTNLNQILRTALSGPLQRGEVSDG
jgi:hypothetical protein